MTKATEQFELITDDPRDPSRAPCARLEAWKEQWGVWTIRSHVERPWLAMAFRTALTALDGYGLNEEERANPMALYAGYCRLMDEAGMIADGDTELEACRILASHMTWVIPLS